MAFFGLQWVPTLESDIRVSEADEAQLAEIAYTIREKGREAMNQRTLELNQQYGTEYYAVQAKQAEAASWNEYMQNRFAGVSATDVSLIQNAAMAWRNGSEAYYSYEAGLSSDDLKAMISEYYQLLEAHEAAEKAEAEVWNTNSQAQDAQRVSELFAFEAQSAVNQQKKIRDGIKEEKKRRKEILKANERYMRALRKMNKASSRTSRAQVQLESRAETAESQKKRPVAAVDNEAASVLSGLDKLLISASSPSVSHKKASDQKGILSGWFGPKHVETKDFL